MSQSKDNKYKKLFLGLLFDAIGMLSFAIPLIGDFSDIVWAPLAAWLMTRMYKGNIGKGAGIVTFLEEIIPGLDVIPTFTIMWLYTYVFKKSTQKTTIEV
ncbi:hypothetical protein [Pseudozobellia thermophila]|uniref:Uncharacterized protein n=1 Tax=Pseudozobellia thermophila TaxID=192903 RepID=A0A1M6F017_9FLAO|nr:hypothetical protein [Pseudozobellia thermophila]SHI91068.1 hypothetical protein SAMN04488513_102246 [Pseudozobellia thermophila]